MRRLEPASLEAMRFITLSDPETDVSRLPNFLIAGPQRTGSTWLYHQLERHPQICLSQPKEIFYFDTLGNEQHPLHVSSDLGWYLKHFEQSEEQVATRDAQCREDFDRPYEPKVFGEATASNAAGISGERLEDLMRLIPDLKVVIIVRNPVMRAWSHAKLDLARLMHRSIAEVSAVELDEYFENPWVRLCGFYRQMEECWLGALRPGNLLIRPFDDIQARPLELVLDIHRLIGVDAEERFVPLANKGRNESEASDGVPEPWLSRLREVYADEMQYWNERFGLNWK